jgi:hypothetical protein
MYGPDKHRLTNTLVKEVLEYNQTGALGKIQLVREQWILDSVAAGIVAAESVYRHGSGSASAAPPTPPKAKQSKGTKRARSDSTSKAVPAHAQVLIVGVGNWIRGF